MTMETGHEAPRLLHARPDGSYVVSLRGSPYHVTADDPLFALAAEMAEGADLEPEMPIEAPAPVAAAPVISDRQFAQQLAVLGTITEAEALAWAARGELPDAMEDAIAALPETDRFGARMLLASATTYERAHPLVAQLGALLDYDDADLDDLWRAAALL